MSDGVWIALISSGLALVATVITASLARLSHRDGGLETRSKQLERENRALQDYALALRADAREHDIPVRPWPDSLTD